MKERSITLKRKFMNDNRKTGFILILVGIGLPLIIFFLLESGSLRLFSSTMVAERSLTPREIIEIKRIIIERKKRMTGIEKAVEEVKESYRKKLGEDYFKERWLVRWEKGFILSFKYILAIGSLFFLVGLGKFILG